jgi:glycosyltransferase involved in cell wall biosynthesis
MPSIKIRIGGVTNYVTTLIKNLDDKCFNVIDKTKYLKGSQKLQQKSKIDSFLIKIIVILNLLLFPIRLVIHKIDIVHSNPSLAINAVIREAIYIIVAWVLRRRVLVFFHGWHNDCLEIIEKNYLFRKIFVWAYNKADVICVLAEEFKNTLEKWGIKPQIYVETTMVSNKLLSGFDIKNSLKNRKSEIKNILFLSRIEKSKGIIESIDTIKILRKKNYNVQLLVAGNGTHYNEVKKYIEPKADGIKMLGYIEGINKQRIFEASFAFILPSYSEGMPISVLEAMSFGLPVITRPLGGLKDFFKNGRHGFMTTSTDPEVFAKKLEKIIQSKKLYNEIALFNYNYAKTRLMASEVTKRIGSIYTDICVPDQKN